MKKLFLLLSLGMSLSSFALEQGQKKDFIPKDWEIVEEVKGDLNKDGREDLVLHIANFKEEVPEPIFSAMGNMQDFVPRKLIVLFKTEKGDYVSKVSTDIDNSLEWIEIRKNNTLLLQYSYIRGGSTFIYRWQNNRMELIGEDVGGITSAGRLFWKYSRNYSTGIEIVDEALNGTDKDLKKIEDLGLPTQVQIKKKFKIKRKYTLEDGVNYDNLDGNIVYEPLNNEEKEKMEKFEKIKQLYFSFPDE